MKELIAEELSNSISSLPNYEVYFSEGDTGELRLYLERPLYQGEIDQLEQQILSQGVVLTEPIMQDTRIVSIKFQKTIAPLVIIAIAIVAVITGLLGWQIWKSVQLGVPLWLWAIAGGAVLYLLLSSKPAKEAGGLAIQAGKVYVTRKAVG